MARLRESMLYWKNTLVCKCQPKELGSVAGCGPVQLQLAEELCNPFELSIGQQH